MGKHSLIVMKTLGMVIGRLGDVPVRVNCESTAVFCPCGLYREGMQLGSHLLVV
jgi:hypothetical protein